MRMFCWEQHYADTMNSFNDMSPLLREKGRVSASEVKGHLARNWQPARRGDPPGQRGLP